MNLTLKRLLGIAGLLPLVVLFFASIVESWEYPGFIPSPRESLMAFLIVVSVFCTSAVKVQLIKDRPFDILVFLPAGVGVLCFCVLFTLFPSSSNRVATELLDAASLITANVNLLLDLFAITMFIFLEKS